MTSSTLSKRKTPLKNRLEQETIRVSALVPFSSSRSFLDRNQDDALHRNQDDALHRFVDAKPPGGAVVC